jgi:hypothetical protein
VLDVRERKVEGWKAIAEAVGVDERTARRYAALRHDPLPVYWRRRGGYVVAHATALRDWVARQDIPLDMRDSFRE